MILFPVSFLQSLGLWVSVVSICLVIERSNLLKATKQNQNEEVGGLAGLGAGVIAGASAGTAVMPVLGTFTGALIGGLFGNELGKTIGGPLLDTFSWPEEPEYPTPQPVQPEQSAQAASGEDVLSQLERLSQLKSQGMISEEEFKAAKARLLGLG